MATPRQPKSVSHARSTVNRMSSGLSPNRGRSTLGSFTYSSQRWLAEPVKNLRKMNKTLSENRQIEQNVRASKLNECQPVSGLLRPTSAQTTTLDEPRNRALHYPSPRWINSSCRALIRRKPDVLSSRIDLDMRLVAPGS